MNAAPKTATKYGVEKFFNIIKSVYEKQMTTNEYNNRNFLLLVNRDLENITTLLRFNRSFSFNIFIPKNKKGSNEDRELIIKIFLVVSRLSNSKKRNPNR